MAPIPPVTDEQLHKVCGTALVLWQGFSDTQPGICMSRALFDFDQRLKICPCVRAFFNYCVGITLGQQSVANIVFAELPATAAGHAASWLWNDDLNSPKIIIDNAHLESVVRFGDVQKVRTRLALHEIGHVALHWNSLINLKRRVGPALPPSSYEQEQEAWLFAHTVIGIALGVVAHTQRMGPPLGHDGAWKFS